MTKQLTRQEVEAVMEKIKNPNPTLQCPECWNDCVQCTECNSTVWKNDHTYIGTVLDKLVVKFTNYCLYSSEDDYGYIETLIQLWRPLILSSSLQEIINESGYFKEWIHCGNCGATECEPCECDIERFEDEYLTSPETNALFSFLQEIL